MPVLPQPTGDSRFRGNGEVGGMGREEWSKNKNTSHSRESGNLPTSAPTARILSGSGAGRALPVLPQREIPAFAGMGGYFFVIFFVSSPAPALPHSPIPPTSPFPPPFPFPRKRESPDSSANGANHKQEWRILSPLTIPPSLSPSFSPSHSPPILLFPPFPRKRESPDPCATGAN